MREHGATPIMAAGADGECGGGDARGTRTRRVASTACACRSPAVALAAHGLPAGKGAVRRRHCARVPALGLVANVLLRLGVGQGRAGGAGAAAATVTADPSWPALALAPLASAAAPAFSALSRADGVGFDWRCLGGGSQVLAGITDLRGRSGGGALRERGRRENGNAAHGKLRRRARRSLLLSACARAYAEDGGVGRDRGSGVGGGHARCSSGTPGAAGGDASPGRGGAAASSGRVSPAAGDCAERNRISGGRESEAAEQQIRALLWMLEEEQNAADRRNIIITLQHVAPRSHPLVIDALCACLLNYKREAIPTRIAVLRALEKLSVRGNAAVVDVLLTCVEKDNCFEVRQPAMALLAAMAPLGEERVMELALQHLRKKDLRGEPLFKPYGDPMALTQEAIRVLANVAPRGSQEAWSLLLRRVVDDSVLAVRIAAVEALASIADPDMIADGGARGTVQAIALAMLDEQHLDSYRLHKAGDATFRSLMHPADRQGAVAGGVYWG